MLARQAGVGEYERGELKSLLQRSDTLNSPPLPMTPAHAPIMPLDGSPTLPAAITASSLAMGMADVEGRVTWCNPAFTEITGFALEEIVGRRPGELLHGPGTDPAIGEFIRQGHAARHSFTVELQAYKKSGTPYWTHLQIDPVFDATGIHTGWIYIENEITASRQAAESLRRAQALLVESQRLARIGSWEWRMEGDQVEWTDELFHFFGIDPAEGAASFEAHTRLYEPESFALLAEAVQRAVTEGTPYHLANLRAILRDGSRRWVTARGEVVRDASGAISGLRGTLQDVTDSYSAEREREELSLRLQLALEASGDGIYDWDMRTGCVQYSERWKSMLGYDDHDVGTSLSEWSDRAHPEDLAVAQDRLDAHFRGDTSNFAVDMRMRRKDGAWHWVRSRGKVVEREADGTPARLVGTHSDIQSEKVAEAALRDARDTAELATQAKSDFLARMSHELRIPLNSIIGFSQTVRKQRADALGPRHALQLDRVVANGKHLLDLINDILDLSRIEANRMSIDLAPVRLAALVEDVREILEPLVARDVAFQVDAVDTDIVLTTDHSKLTQLLVNVIGNALKFTAHGSVQVRVHSTASQVVIRVHDTGPGIPAARLDSIFDAFEQVNGSTHRRHGGTGLGLAISRSIVGLLGGTLTVESVLGRGSTFLITLPRSASAPAEMAA